MTGTSYTEVIEVMTAGTADAFEVGPFSYLFAVQEAQAEALEQIELASSGTAPFHAALPLANQGNLPRHESVNLVSQSPANAVRLTDRGQIAVGLRADLVLFDGGEFPRVRATLRNGVPIYWDSKMAHLAELQHMSVSIADQIVD